MDKILIYWDTEGDTLNIWLDDPQKEHVCEETGDEVILSKDVTGRVIGFEKLNYRLSHAQRLNLSGCQFPEACFVTLFVGKCAKAHSGILSFRYPAACCGRDFIGELPVEVTIA